MSKHTIQEAPSLLVDTLRQFTSLVQGEVKLAKAEMSRIVTRAGIGIAFLAVAFLLALVSLNVLASAAVAYIAANGLSVGTAALIVGGILIVAATGFALAGKSRLSADALTPDKTADSIRDDITAIREASNV
ncbi:putative superfamily III holin-X [Yoonia maricola]|uniref:Putative superfamily III holin-X n=1 Tax=Yoonia maricola TaxID=420999 RepID=A0A2M8W0L0_9RHOB|nr:phage holin family protein [Yoonia maricola]PJI84461.1 putative superfamily III holin-X [Yoonia maricola]